jgi:amidase
MTDIAFLPARRLAGMIRRRKIGCLELLDHYLARVERFNPALNAIIATDIPAARRRARAADKAVASGDRWGPLHGVPMTVKESFDVKGLPTTWGDPGHKDNIAAADALSVTRLRDAGAVVFGKTNVPIWLADSQSFNANYGTTISPWNPERTPGGSSGGSAAALAAGLSALEMGSDIAGSIRNPAAYCGLFGHKPTMGICPTLGHTLDGNVAPLDMLVIGPLARSAADLAVSLSIIAGPDDIDSAGLRLALPSARKKRLDEYRISILVDDETVPTDREVCGLQQRLADFLRSSKVKVDIGARPDFDAAESHRIYDILLRSGTSARQTDTEFADNLAARNALGPSDESKQARRLRGLTLSHRDWLRLDEARHRIRWKWHEFFQKYDLMLTPITVSAAFAHNTALPYERSIPVDGAMQPFMNQISLPGYSNLASLPTTIAPIGFTNENLPLGVQIIGPQYGDRSCIHFAGLLEKHYQGFVPPPGYA